MVAAWAGEVGRVALVSTAVVVFCPHCGWKQNAEESELALDRACPRCGLDGIDARPIHWKERTK